MAYRDSSQGTCKVGEDLLIFYRRKPAAQRFGGLSSEIRASQFSVNKIPCSSRLEVDFE